MSQAESEPICFLNGSIRPASEASIPVNDLGFIHGVTVSEQIRTFHGTPFLLHEHLKRFRCGLDLLQIHLPDFDELATIVSKISTHNFHLQNGKQELGICLFATPGPSPRFSISKQVNQECRPTVCVHAYALPQAEMAERYRSGVQLKIASNTEVPTSCWPKDVKIRSRLHYFLADLEMQTIDPDCVAILADKDELSEVRYLRETSTSTPIFVFDENELTIPPEDKILSSVSLEFLLAIANELEFKIVRREISIEEIDQLRSMFLVSTPYCIYDVKTIESRELQGSSPELRQLKSRWKEVVNFDFEMPYEN